MNQQTSSPTRRNEILTGIVVLGLSIGTFLVGEIGLRAAQLARFGVASTIERASPYRWDEESGLRLPLPNQMLGQVRINNLGYRGPDVPADKPEDTIRLLFIGSSTTYDGTVPEGRNWPHLTSTLLLQALPECRIDFVNAAHPGVSIRELSRLYETRLRALDPDVAILLPPDLNNNLDWLAGKQGFDTVHYRPSLAAELSVLWAKLEKNFRIIELQRGAYSRAGKARLDLPALSQRFGERLAGLAAQIKADGVTLVVAKNGSQLQPDQAPREQLRAGNTIIFYIPQFALPDILATRLHFNELIGEMASVEGFDSIDSALSVPGDPAHYSDTSHFTSLGSEVMARETVTALLAAPAVRARLRERGCNLD